MALDLSINILQLLLFLQNLPGVTALVKATTQFSEAFTEITKTEFKTNIQADNLCKLVNFCYVIFWGRVYNSHVIVKHLASSNRQLHLIMKQSVKFIEQKYILKSFKDIGTKCWYTSVLEYY